MPGMAARAEIESGRLRRVTLRVWLAVGVVALLGVSWRVFAPVFGVVIAPLLWAVVIVYLLDPVVSALARAGLPRFLGTLLAYVLTIALVVVPVVLALPSLAAQASAAFEQAPETVTRVAEDVEGWLAGLGVNLDLAPLQVPGDALPSLGESAGAAAAVVLGGLSGLAAGLLHLVVIVLLGPVIAFYTLVDLPRLRAWTVAHLPPGSREEIISVGRRLTDVLGGYLRGQILVAVFVGAAATLGMRLIDLPYWLLVGLIAGVTNLVPLLGPFVAGIVGAAIALADSGPALALLVVAVLTLVQQVDNHLISPLVMGQTVSLHPLIVLLALLVGGTLYGIVGLLLAVPLVAGSRVVATHLWSTRVSWATPTAAADVVTADAGRAAVPGTSGTPERPSGDLESSPAPAPAGAAGPTAPADPAGGDEPQRRPARTAGRRTR